MSGPPIISAVRLTWNPRDWYWRVGTPNSPATQIYSSASGQYVPESDSTYVAWVAAYLEDRTSLIDSQQDLEQALFHWDLTFRVPA